VIGWSVVLLSAIVAAVSTTVAVSSAAVGRIELTRWISRRLRGAAMASTLYSAPGTVLRTATAAGSAGMLGAGFGLAVLLTPAVPLVPRIALVLFAAVPLAAILVFAIPRVLGQRWPEAIVRRATPWCERVARVFSPFLAISRQASRTDIKEILRTRLGFDEYDPNEMRVLSGVLAFSERMVRDVMTPRTEIVALEEGASMEEVGRIFSESGYSRIPVYRGSLDDIMGMVYAFDVLKVTPGGELPLRPVAEAPGSKDCAALLLEMQRERRHMAVVLDEFGGTAGIITLQDLLEELLGDVFDDEAAGALEMGSPDVQELDGATPSSEVASRFGVQLPAGAETIGGLLARKAGRIPQPGERLILDGMEFDVVDASPTRIHRLTARRGPVRAVVLSERNAK
jgi:CBS domain containing-hemolysin-like protein